MFAFAGTLILNRSFARELPNDCLDALISAPISGAALFLGKALANYRAGAGRGTGVAAGVRDLLQCAVDAAVLATACWCMALGTWGMTVIGTIFSALTVNIRLREVMLPMLTYPILIPALMGAMRLTSDLVAGKPIGGGYRGLAEDADRLRRDVHCGLAGPGGDGFSGVKTMRDKILYVLGALARDSAGARHLH